MGTRAILKTGLVAAALCMTAFAQSPEVPLARSTELRADKLPDAPPLRILEAGTPLRVLASEANWAWVEAGADRGWVRSSALREGAAAGAAEVPVGGSGLVMRAMPARSNRHALIIGVSRYKDPAMAPLPGAKIDRESATQMAQAMQIPLGNIRYLQDEQATGDAIRKAVRDLQHNVMDGDRVFIHFSGHGTRYNDARAGGCVEALLAYDGGWPGTITNREMADLLTPISRKTDKLFVMYDACHSGGVIASDAGLRFRGSTVRGDEGRLRPKFSATSEACGRPVNVKTRNLVVEAVDQGTLPQDIVHLSSSRDNEVSFDDELKGGLATQFMRDCMLRDATDLDGSGAITIDEIRACAQQKINKRMEGDALFRPHNLTLSGNNAFIPAWFGKEQLAPVSATTAPVALVTMPTPPVAVVPPPKPPVATVQQQPPKPPVTSVTPPVQPPLAVVTPPATPMQTAPTPVPPVAVVTPPLPAPPPVAIVPPPPLSGTQALRQMFDQRDAKRRVQVSLARPKLVIGRDALEFSVQADRPGYVYVAMAGSDGKSLYLLFPNDLDRDNRVEPGKPLQLPRPTWRVRAGGPAGTDDLLVIVSDAPRDLAGLTAAAKVGPFIKSLNDTEGRASLGALMTRARASGTADCSLANRQKNAAACSDAYGAAMVAVEETQ